MDGVQSHSESDERLENGFRRRAPLTFSPSRQYTLAVIPPLQKQGSCETVLTDQSTETSPAITNRLQQSPRYTRERQRDLTIFKPFSFDLRDSARKVEFEWRMEQLRFEQLMAERSTFKAHPVRRYKPIIQPPTHSKAL